VTPLKLRTPDGSLSRVKYDIKWSTLLKENYGIKPPIESRVYINM
jgi:hypothetical protein